MIRRRGPYFGIPRARLIRRPAVSALHSARSSSALGGGGCTRGQMEIREACLPWRPARRLTLVVCDIRSMRSRIDRSAVGCGLICASAVVPSSCVVIRPVGAASQDSAGWKSTGLCGGSGELFGWIPIFKVAGHGHDPAVHRRSDLLIARRMWDEHMRFSILRSCCGYRTYIAAVCGARAMWFSRE